MKKLNVADFFAVCEALLPQFQKEEIRCFPENKYIFKSLAQMNASLKKKLDDIKRRARFDPDELYIWVSHKGKVSVNFGVELLRMEVVFAPGLTGRKVKKIVRKAKQSFNLELELTNKYRITRRLFYQTAALLMQSRNVKYISNSNLKSAIESLEIDYDDLHYMYFNVMPVISDQQARFTLQQFMLDNVKKRSVIANLLVERRV